jgi:SdpI/YfhL protein family
MPMTDVIVVTAALGLVAAVSVVTTHMAASGKLRRNQTTGIRVPATMASDAAWRAGHRAAMPLMWLTVPVAIVGSVVVAVTNVAFGGVLPGFMVVLVAILIAAAVVANKAARRV